MDVEARLATGRIRGRAADGYAVFRNIPFARPPVGDLRFAAPQPPLAWDGVRDGTRSGPGCPQPALPGADPMARLHNPAVTGDDCLTLEVWTPGPGPFPVGLPVMVWI
ncbi:carboxylesterase family protein, partial [Streptomyces sp. NPDC059900]